MSEVHALFRLLSELREGDMLFLDEIHAVPRPVLEVLYEAMAEGHLTLTLRTGTRERCVRLELEAFTLLTCPASRTQIWAPPLYLPMFGVRDMPDVRHTLTHRPPIHVNVAETEEPAQRMSTRDPYTDAMLSAARTSATSPTARIPPDASNTA